MSSASSAKIVEKDTRYYLPRQPTKGEPTSIFDVFIKDKVVKALYDTRSMVNTISADYAKRLSLEVEPIGVRVMISSFSRDDTAVSGMVKNVSIGVEGLLVDDQGEIDDGLMIVDSILFVTDKLDEHYGLILGQLFRRLTHSSIYFNDETDGDVMEFRNPETGGTIIVFPQEAESPSKPLKGRAD